jgi:hypothetical protein
LILVLIILCCLDLLLFFRQEGEFVRMKHIHIKWKLLRVFAVATILFSLCSFCCIMNKIRNSYEEKLRNRKSIFEQKLESINYDIYDRKGLVWKVGPYSAWIYLASKQYLAKKQNGSTEVLDNLGKFILGKGKAYVSHRGIDPTLKDEEITTQGRKSSGTLESDRRNLFPTY